MQGWGTCGLADVVDTMSIIPDDWDGTDVVESNNICPIFDAWHKQCTTRGSMTHQKAIVLDTLIWK